MKKNNLNTSILNTLFNSALKNNKEDTSNTLTGGAGGKNSGQLAFLLLALMLIHIVGTLNVGKMCNLEFATANRLTQLFFGLYFAFIFIVLMFIVYIFTKPKHKKSTLAWLIGFASFFTIVMLAMGIAAMAIDNNGSPTDKGYSYTSVILVNLALLCMVIYAGKLKRVTTQGSNNEEAVSFTEEQQ